MLFVTNPGAGQHTLQINVLGQRNARSSGFRVDVDAFIIMS